MICVNGLWMLNSICNNSLTVYYKHNDDEDHRRWKGYDSNAYMQRRKET